MASKTVHNQAGASRPLPDSGVGLAALVVFALFLATAALLGGSSRPDPAQIVVLRPLAALLLIPVLYSISRAALMPGRAPLALLLALAALMALQLLPLPPSIWHGLPGRGPVVALDEALGRADQWRPLSMVPGRTLNALASLIVPITACLIALAYQLDRAALLWAVFALGLASSVLGLLQVSGLSFLYFYDFASAGTASGLLANRNHGATLAVITMLTGFFLVVQHGRKSERGLRRAILLGGVAIALLSALVSGSRAGLAALMAAAVLAMAMAFAAGMFPLKGGRRSSHGHTVAGTLSRSQAGLVVAAAVVSLAAVIALFAMFDAIPALERLAERGIGDQMREGLWPVLVEMLRTYSWAGTGFGSFEEVYHIHERTAMMAPQYVNQAHNDVAQFLIEGGAAAAAIAVLGSAWVMRRVLRAMRGQWSAARAIYWFGIVLVLFAASAVDYPLRTPLMQVVGVFLLLAFAAEAAPANGTAEPDGRAGR